MRLCRERLRRRAYRSLLRFGDCFGSATRRSALHGSCYGGQIHLHRIGLDAYSVGNFCFSTARRHLHQQTRAGLTPRGSLRVACGKVNRVESLNYDSWTFESTDSAVSEPLGTSSGCNSIDYMAWPERCLGSATRGKTEQRFTWRGRARMRFARARGREDPTGRLWCACGVV